MTNRPKGSPTALNIFVLSAVFCDGRTEVPNKLDANRAPHIRRCLKAGLLRADDKRLSLTDKGVRVLDLYRSGATAKALDAAEVPS